MVNRFMPILDIVVSSFTWLIPICFIGAAFYAWLLYGKRNQDRAVYSTVFASFLRFSIVFILIFLLLSPIVRRIVRSYKAPLIVLAIDNSASVKLLTGDAVLKDFMRKTDNLIKSLEDRGFDVKIVTLNQQKYTFASAVPFRAGTTDLDRLLERSIGPYKEANLTSLILISDGNFNRGLSSASDDHGTKIFTVGLGSEASKPDIALTDIRYSPVVYTGNQFSIAAAIKTKGFKGIALEVILKEKDRVLERKTVTPTGDRFMGQVEFIHSTSEKGFRHYIVEIHPHTGEFTLENNHVDALIRVTDIKKKILIVAAVPHPDIKAIRSALEGKSDYEITSVIATEAGEVKGPFDIVILHGMPHKQGFGSSLLKKYASGVVPVWLITGADPAIQDLKSVAGVTSVESSSLLPYGTLVYDKTFGAFDFSESEKAFLSDAPDFYIPRVEMRFKTDADVLLSTRRPGSKSPTPIFMVNKNKSSKIFLTLGEGFWKWRLHEFKETEKHVVIDGLINKIVRYLCESQKNKKIDVYLPQTEWEEGEVFEAEVKTEISDGANKHTVEFIVEDERGSIVRTMHFSSDVARVSLPNLPAGIYRYTASVLIEGEKAQESGMFIVQRNHAETIESAADHSLLKETAIRSGGRFVPSKKLETLLNFPEFKKAQSQVTAHEELTEPINIFRIFILILALVSSEWFFRRYRGFD